LTFEEENAIHETYEMKNQKYEMIYGKSAAFRVGSGQSMDDSRVTIYYFSIHAD
jgi:hypothetical protein